MSKAQTDFTKPHEFTYSDYEIERGVNFCACGLPEDSPLHIKPAEEPKNLVKSMQAQTLPETNLLTFKNYGELLKTLSSLPKDMVCLVGYVDEKGDIQALDSKLLSTQKAEIRELVYSCLYDPQWVEVATPANFEAGKLNITKFLVATLLLGMWLGKTYL